MNDSWHKKSLGCDLEKIESSSACFVSVTEKKQQQQEKTGFY